MAALSDAEAALVATSIAPSPAQELPPTPGSASIASTSGGELLATASGVMANGIVLSEVQLGNMALRAKQQRVKAEQDRQLLQNRINRLIIEQSKATKRIAETRRRAEDISSLKARNSQTHEARKDAGNWMHSEQEVQRKLMTKNREQRRQAIANSRKSMLDLRIDEVKVLRAMRQENEDVVAQQREAERQRAAERREVVKQSKAAAAERKAAEQQALKARLRLRREEKRQEVDSDAMGHLNAYSSLAEEEARLLQSIAKWSQIQTDASEQLDGVLVQSRATSRAASRPVSRQLSSSCRSGGGSPRSTGGLAAPAAPAAAPEAAVAE